MPQDTPQRKVKKHQQLIQALDLRAAGASYRQIGEALSVSKPRAFRVVRAALDELVQHCQDTAERVRQLELYRLDRYRLSLDSRKGDPRTVDTLIRISERVAKLHGLDAPQRIEASGPNGGPIETEEKTDYSKLTVDELLLLEAMQKKARGIANWDEHLRYTEEHRRCSYPGVQQPEIWTEGLKKLGILATAREMEPARSRPAGTARNPSSSVLTTGEYTFLQRSALMLRIPVVVASLLTLVSLSDHVQPKKMTLPEAIEFTRPSVVQISVRVDQSSSTGPLQLPPRRTYVNLGSGFLVSADGYAVTARHVVHDFQGIQIEGHKTLAVGLALPNLENYKSGGATLTIRASFMFIDCEVVDEDVRHDLALLKLKRNPFTEKTGIITTPKETVGYLHSVAALSPTRPQDGEAIAVSGYPLNQTVLITTSGNLASSWAYDSVSTQAPGAPPGFMVPDTSDYYIGDMHVNPGNSGGPVYSVEQGKVIGVCVAYDMAPVVYGDGNHEPASAGNRSLFSNSGLAVVIPVRYVIDLLKKHNLK